MLLLQALHHQPWHEVRRAGKCWHVCLHVRLVLAHAVHSSPVTPLGVGRALPSAMHCMLAVQAFSWCIRQTLVH